MSWKSRIITLVIVFLSASIIIHLILVQKSEEHKQRGLWLYSHADHPSVAEEDLLQSITLNLFNAEAYFYLGQVYSVEGSRDDEKALKMFRYATWFDWSNCLYHARYLDKILETKRYSVLEGATKRASRCEFRDWFAASERYEFWANMVHALYILKDIDSLQVAFINATNLREAIGDDSMTAEPFYFYGLTIENTGAQRELLCGTYQYAMVFYSPELGDLPEWLSEIEIKIDLFCSETVEA